MRLFKQAPRLAEDEAAAVRLMTIANRSKQARSLDELQQPISDELPPSETRESVQ